ncbi:TIP-1 family-domain-containing protein [Lipomyces japonicus]|uniref:TIP-1 family-domain-containing protein n=1 Tax=Lipomyces japonicus TaxID=56871 RepID=UPI0034CD7731
MLTVTEYINEKLPSVDSLANLDDLVTSLDEYQSGLNSQIQNSENKVTNEHASILLVSDKIFEDSSKYLSNYDDLQLKLANIAYASKPDLLAKVDNFISKLSRLQIARDYFRVLDEIHCLSALATSAIYKDAESALKHYSDLSRLYQLVYEKNKLSDDPTTYLVPFMEQSRLALRASLQDKLSSDLRNSLDAIGWPSKISFKSDFNEFCSAFTNLILFQDSSFVTKNIDGNNNEPSQIIAFEVLIEQLDLRFRYHFEGNRDTNRLDKPEWVFSHVLATVEEHENFLQTVVQGVLRKSVYGQSRQALHEFIYAYLPSVVTKLKSMIPIAMSQPQLLSHIMMETMKFDEALREIYLFSPFGVNDWQGLSGMIISNHGWFQGWLTIEKNFALARYREIITAPDAWLVDSDSAGDAEAKSTKSALRLRYLLETITDRYKSLRSFTHKVNFLMDIQVFVLDSYHGRISASLDAFESLTSSLVRAVSGVHEDDRQKMVEGISGIERLCRAYCSAFSIRDALNDWGEDIFFLELYEEITLRASPKTKKSLHTEISFSDIPDDQGTIFDETVKFYERLQERAENLIIKHLQREAQRVYRKDAGFRQMVKNKDHSPMEVLNSSADLSAMLHFLSVTISNTSFKKIIHAWQKSLNF